MLHACASRHSLALCSNHWSIFCQIVSALLWAQGSVHMWPAAWAVQLGGQLALRLHSQYLLASHQLLPGSALQLYVVKGPAGQHWPAAAAGPSSRLADRGEVSVSEHAGIVRPPAAGLHCGVRYSRWSHGLCCMPWARPGMHPQPAVSRHACTAGLSVHACC